LLLAYFLSVFPVTVKVPSVQTQSGWGCKKTCSGSDKRRSNFLPELVTPGYLTDCRRREKLDGLELLHGTPYRIKMLFPFSRSNEPTPAGRELAARQVYGEAFAIG
jgi:hypothetical protein